MTCPGRRAAVASMDDRDRPRDDPGLLTLTEAAARSGHTRIALRQRVRRGTLPSIKGNDGVVRIRAADVDGLPPPDAATDDQDQPEAEAVAAALDAMRQAMDDTRADRDRAWSSLDHVRSDLEAARSSLAAESLRAALAEEKAMAATTRTAMAEARLAAAEAALAEARVPLLLRVIAALRRR